MAGQVALLTRIGRTTTFSDACVTLVLLVLIVL